ncbi:MAG TPA: RNA pseudouridine synthase, partial [Planctomycetaceae bacterium]|nr:RNA pseudouridine synthase [Planctomycetaceae bacterium]
MNDLDLLLDDGPLIAVNKPAGIPTQSPTPPSLDHSVREWIRQETGKPGQVYLGIPHRLDRPVSGVVTFARNSKCAARLAEQFAERQVKKTYWGLLEGVLPQKRGMLVDRLRKNPLSKKTEIVDDEDELEGTQEARLLYRILETFSEHESGPRTLVEIELITGRMHQIRIQFGSRGFPVVGDTLYGSQTQLEPLDRNDDGSRPIFLHARELKLQHPIRYDEL